MMIDEQRDKKLELIKNQVRILMDSFDTVMIFATKHDPESENTTMFNQGSGNYFARYGQVKDWINHEEGKTMRGE